MASPDVVTPALLLSIPMLSLASLFYNWRFHRTTPLKVGLLILIAILSAVAGGTGLSGATNRCQLLRIVAKAFTNLLECALSGISLYDLVSSSYPPAWPSRVLRFFLALTAFLIACELVSALVPEGPPLLPPILALTSRSILLSLAMSTTVRSCSGDAAIQAEADIEKGRSTQNTSPGKTPARVSSPTPDTWPFPASLAPRSQPKNKNRSYSARSKASVASLPPSSTLTQTRECEKWGEHHNVNHAQSVGLLPAVLVAAQMTAIICATLSVACIVAIGASSSSIIGTNASLPRVLIARAICTLLWTIAVLAIIQLIPANPQSHTSDAAKQSATGQRPPTQREPEKFGCGVPTPRTLKPSLTRFGSSDSTPDFLSLRDPFASPPPPPPPFPPVGLGLDEVDVGWNENKEIGMQYRFPAPRSMVNGKGRGKGKKIRASGRKRLVHQGSAQTLFPLPPLPTTRRTEVDVDKDNGFGDEARIAQLLLQSLTEGTEECESPHTPTLPTVPLPQAMHVPLSSRWSTSTTVRSAMTASFSNRSGVSTYASCASEREQANRVSMNTVASGLASRKSSEARRKSGATASSWKG
ncbi:hypothetical protein BS17DRAFT_775105 [Gyrodon lividus]|nr:hypothetical protein BS17DRAFT_775105 [Gyrodon lividus]